MTILITEFSGSSKTVCAASTRLELRCERRDSRDNALRVSQCTLRTIAAQVSDFCPIFFQDIMNNYRIVTLSTPLVHSGCVLRWATKNPTNGSFIFFGRLMLWAGLPALFLPSFAQPAVTKQTCLLSFGEEHFTEREDSFYWIFFATSQRGILAHMINLHIYRT